MSWQNSKRLRGWAALIAALGGIALVWGLLLPMWGRSPAWQRRLNELDRQGVDAGAFFYTDHPRLMEELPVEDRADETRHRAAE